MFPTRSYDISPHCCVYTDGSIIRTRRGLAEAQGFVGVPFGWPSGCEFPATGGRRAPNLRLAPLITLGSPVTPFVRTCVFPRCPLTRQPSPGSSFSVSTEPPISSIRRSGAWWILSHDAHTDLRVHQNTNLVKFYALLDKCCPLEQIVYYQVRIYSTSASVPIELSTISYILNAPDLPPSRLASEPTSTQEWSAHC